MKNTQIQKESLSRAVNNQSMSNYPAIFAGFIEKGISEDQIIPRENVFTYNAWIALGRQVQAKQKGVKIVSWIVCGNKKDDDEKKTYRRPKTTTVFHVSQTKPI